MKSSILIASYLWKDTWKRWFEQPSSPLARLFVTGLLALVATVILVAFHLLERSIRERLERFGLNTVLVRETITTESRELTVFGDAPHRLAPLAEQGQLLRVRQLFVRGITEFQNSVMVFTYSPAAFEHFVGFLSPKTAAILFTEDLPGGVLVRVNVNRHSTLAVSRQPQGWLRPLLAEDVLLVPQGTWPDEERLGFVETTIFQRKPDGQSVAHVVSAVNNFFTLERERRSPPQVQSALPLIRELEKLKERQVQWRNLLAAILGIAVSLVYGSIAVLEFRQNLFVSALLRSFGAPRRYLFWRHLVENSLLANLAALCAILLLAMLHKTLFGTLGFARPVLEFSGGNPYVSAEVLSILIWVNIGAVLSSIPILVGLRTPVGATLN
ncbi:MAG: hypothetical protein L0Y58_12090 [Verrucomicrobia subdivision 3 bacterium]|nr:hypothetical protein [Limisphaerales bacterium]